MKRLKNGHDKVTLACEPHDPDPLLSPEIEIDFESTLLRYNNNYRRPPMQLACTPKKTLGEFHLHLKVTAAAPEFPLFLRTAQGARTLWKFGSPKEEEEEFGNLGTAVELGLISLTIAHDNTVTLSLTEYAFEICHPGVLPISSRKIRNKQHQQGLVLKQAFAEIFPKQSCFFPLATPGQGGQTVTAKQVYAHTDNVQIKAHSNKKPPPGGPQTLHIPGLAPTLRPYQAAAVQWMLDRERGMAACQSGGEWELAWILVDRAAVSFLPDYTKHLPPAGLARTSPGMFLVCPFTMWLAASVEEAREMTLGSGHPSDPTDTPRGGILAESMGLGKTVEVLACILANPATIGTSQASMRNHVVSVESSVASTSQDMSEIPPPPRLGSRSHYNALLDASSEPTKAGRVSPSTSSISTSDTSIPSTPTYPTEFFVDGKEYELGSCICGKPISIFPSPKKDSVVLCEGCQEPMHWECAAFESERETMFTMDKCILYRQKFSNESFSCRLCPPTFCPFCVANAIGGQNKTDKKICSRATLVVTPPTILDQWEREIARHTDGTLKVVVYKGIRNMVGPHHAKGATSQWMHPRFLADADIVLMTFDALRLDLGHSNSNPFAGNGQASLRKRKRYRIVPSPLLSISWWRVCLDEAQRVETPTVGSARMALKLDTRHRWCVSGTPIGRGKLDDLFGLLLFLRLTPPFNDRIWFHNCFSSFGNDGYMEKRLKHLLATVFWRSTMSLDSVAKQVGVPPQIEKTNLLQFSKVERHFYNLQLEETVKIVGDLEGKKMQKSVVKCMELLDRQLGKLRAACCHPQVGSSGIVLGRGAKGRVLSMDQVLDRLIDDARNKCEEALRVCLFHTNPMATIARLKVEARAAHNVETISESDDYLYAQSCKLYQDALDLADENAAPSLVKEEAKLSGSHGFRSSKQTVRGGQVVLGWQLQPSAGLSKPDNAWAKIEYDGHGKKIRQVRVRSLTELPGNVLPESKDWRILSPRQLVLQVSNAAAGGSFVDVLSLELPHPSLRADPLQDWVTNIALPIYRSKTWKLVVQSFHPIAPPPEMQTNTTCEEEQKPQNDYFGLEVELYEPTIGFDSLQRLHTLHNAIISFRQLLSVQSKEKPGKQIQSLPLQLCVEDIDKKLQDMDAEYNKIEAYSLEYAKNVRQECVRRLESLVSRRRELEVKLLQFSGVQDKDAGFWDVAWWDDIVAAVSENGTLDEKQSLCEKVREAVDSCSTYEDNFYFCKGEKAKAFPDFRNIHGLAVAMKMRFDDEFLAEIRDGGYHNCIVSILRLSPNPTNKEVFENRTCFLCKADWGQTGPMCGHCKAEDKLKVLKSDSQKLARFVLDAIWKWAKSSSSGVRDSRVIQKCAATGAIFFEIIEVSRKEVLAAARLWTVHLDLLNVMDELNSCKTSMRLTDSADDISQLTEEQRNAVIVPLDICIKYYEHEAKQATALATLRQQKHTLQFLKNQVAEADKRETCMVCLSVFATKRAVLICGHSFHPPCLEFLKQKQKSSMHIRCPLRCSAITKCDDVMIACNWGNDGSEGNKGINGNFGTKVNALVADLIGVSRKDEKSVVFSMWEDMLDILGEALSSNGVKFARASRVGKLREAIKTFRSSECSALLLNVKNGAEGLNLVEATHVFMIEPLLNCGLDSQAIARVHRIGQTKQTFVHRYLVEDTIEIKIDRYRQQHQEDQLEDAILESRKCAIHAGGIDGGFSSKDELMEMLTVPDQDTLR